MFLLSLALAFVLWLAVSGQDMSVHDLTATLDLTSQPNNTDVGDDIPETVNIRVEANTAQLKFLDGRKLYLKLDISNIEIGPNIIPIDWSKLDPPLPRGVRVIRVIPEEISLTAHPFITRQLPVQPTIHGSLPDYLEQIGPMVIDPPMATVTGPENRLAGINFISTNPINMENITGVDSKISLYPQLPGLDTWLKVKPMEYSAHLDVLVKTAKKTIEVPIVLNTPTNIGPNLPLVLKPDKAKVTVSWALNRPQSPEAHDITLSAQPQETFGQKKYQRAPILASVPDNLSIIKIDPPETTIMWQSTREWQNREK